MLKVVIFNKPSSDLTR